MRKLKFFEKISFWWEYSGRYYHRDFIQGVKNIIKWFPVIWKDRDWDDYYIFEVLKFKLKNQAEYTARRDWHTRAQEDAKNMLRCVELIDLVQNETYGAEYMDYVESTFDFIDIPEDERGEWYKEGTKQLHSELIWEKFEDYFRKYPEIYDYVLTYKKAQIFPIDNTEPNFKQRIAMNMGIELHKRAKKELFKILEKNIERWWC